MNKSREKFFAKGGRQSPHCKAKSIDPKVAECKKTFSLTISSTNLKYHLIAGIIFEKRKENVDQTSIAHSLTDEAKKRNKY